MTAIRGALSGQTKTRSSAVGVFFGLIYSQLTMPAFAATPIDPSGLWATGGDESIIKVAPCHASTSFCGTLVWLKEPHDEHGKPKIDTLNKDKTKRGRLMIGIDLFFDLTAESDHWKGKAYNPEDGETYDITFKVVPAAKTGTPQVDKAEIQGCLLKILCKTENFARAQAIPKPGGPQAVPR
jgi:uncharacterized protein (DUF2147 family)